MTIRHAPLRIARWLVAVCVVSLSLLGCGAGTNESRKKDDTQEEKRTMTVAVKDAALTAQVKMALAVKRGVAATEINVDTDEGVVTLHGQVGTEAERQLAVMVARNVDGVKDVVNDIKVR